MCVCMCDDVLYMCDVQQVCRAAAVRASAVRVGRGPCAAPRARAGPRRPRSPARHAPTVTHPLSLSQEERLSCSVGGNGQCALVDANVA